MGSKRVGCIRAVVPLALTLAGCGDDVAEDVAGTGGASSGSTTASDDARPGSTGSTAATDPDSTGDGDESTGTTGGPPATPLSWSDECIALGSDFSNLHPRMECTAVEVPLSWDEPDGEQITVPAFRVRTEADVRRGTLWQLDGGPGGSGIGFFAEPGRVDQLNAEGWDVAVHSHRGTLSPRLSCSSPTYSDQCRSDLEGTWGDGLQHFNTVQAAHDLAELLRRADVDEDGSAVVYGVSYGTYWAQFLLGLHPDAADAVILDSVLAADADVATQEALVDERATAILQSCVDDPVCGARVGYASGEAFSQAVIQAFDTGDCGTADAGTWTESQFREQLGQLLNARTARNYVPLLAAMLARCTPEDTERVAAAIPDIFNGAFSAAPAESPQQRMARARTQSSRYGVSPDVFFSPELFSVVVATTLVTDGTSIELGANVLASIGIPSALEASQEIYADLPDVALDTDFVPQVPVLILNAAYDLQTPLPWADDIAEQYGVEVQVVADGQHSVFSPGTGGRDLDGTPCVRPLALAFAAAPDDPVDAACLGTLPQLDVNLGRADLTPISQAAFGVDDPWTLLE